MTEEAMPPISEALSEAAAHRDWIAVDEEGRLQKEFWCAKCDTDLREQKACGTCPQCGTPVASALAGEPVGFTDDAGIILEPLLCVTCTNSLTGTSAAMECPTCGTPCTHTLGQRYLRYGDPAWLRSIRDGFLWYIIVFFVAIAMGLGATVAAIFIKDRATLLSTMAAVAIVIPIISFIAIWFVTQSAPDDRCRNKANVVRFCAFLMICGGALNGLPLIMPQAQPWAGLPGLLFQIAFTFTFYNYLPTLAQRIPDEKLIKHCRIVLYGLVIAQIFLLIGTVGMALSGVDPIALQQAQQRGEPLQTSGSLPLYYGSLGVLGCLGGLPVLVFMVWSVIIQFWFRSRFALAAKIAALSGKSEFAT